MSAQTEASERTSKKGNKYFIPTRSQKGAASLKAFFLDIDIKNGGYEEVEDAIKALADFLSGTGLPKPTLIVGSGGGLHVYWTLKSPVTPFQWKPVADAFAEAAKELGLKADTACTIDSARILRVPNTFNYKQETLRPVRLAGPVRPEDYDLAEIETPLAKWVKRDISFDPSTVSTLFKDLEVDEGLTTSADAVPEKVFKLQDVKDCCPFIAEATTTGGKSYDNPLWNLTTLLSTFLEEGEQAAHVMAMGHAEYSEESTHELYERKVREKAERGLGWPSCKTINIAGCEACQECGHYSAGKSPLNFVNIGAVGLAPDLPNGYSRSKDGLILRKMVDDLGEERLVPISNYPMIQPWVQLDPYILNFESKVYRTKKQINIPFIAVSSREGILKVLSEQGMVFQDYQYKPVREFIVSWIDHLKNQRDAIVNSAPFGWAEMGGKVGGFSYAGRIWGDNTSRPSVIGDPVLARAHQPMGDIAVWKEAALLVTDQRRPALDVLLASGFAGPMVRLTGQSGLIVAGYSTESGIGKSTALKVATSVWGHPIKTLQGLDDTQISVLRKATELQAIPIFWDEMKTKDDIKKFVNLTFNLSRGRERMRAGRDLSIRDIGVFKTLLVAANNDTIADAVMNDTKSTEAGIYRVFEFVVPTGPGNPKYTTADADVLLEKLERNYGMAGLEFAQYLGSNLDLVAEECVALRKRLDTELETKQPERYWSAGMTAILYGATVANRIGLTDFDLAGIENFLKENFFKMREFVLSSTVGAEKEATISDVLASFLSENLIFNTLWTDRVHMGRGRPRKDGVKVLRNTDKLRAVYVQVASDDKLMRISSRYFSDWMTKRGHSRIAFTKKLKEEYGTREVQGNLGGGTPYATSNQNIIEIDLATTPFLELMTGGSDDDL